jgi:endonuclease-3 related protein
MQTYDSYFRDIYNELHSFYGPQNWWPADTRFEVIIGAILTQNASWDNVEKALDRLRPHLEPIKLYEMDTALLAQLIKPSGFFNVKAKRIKHFLEWFSKKNFSCISLKATDIKELRNELLSINGIGKETADCILLYALDMPIFVIDAYTKRMFARLGLLLPTEYDDIQNLFQNNLLNDVGIFNEYHALIVKHCKGYCRKKPGCDKCFLSKHYCSFDGSRV